jgi:hypothetical protein
MTGDYNVETLALQDPRILVIFISLKCMSLVLGSGMSSMLMEDTRECCGGKTHNFKIRGGSSCSHGGYCNVVDNSIVILASRISKLSQFHDTHDGVAPSVQHTQESPSGNHSHSSHGPTLQE